MTDKERNKMLNLKKGDAPVKLTKRSPGENVTLKCSWSSKTDYDLYAIVLYMDGHVEHIATFGAETKPARTRRAIDPQTTTADGAVRHFGDVGRGVGDAEETVQVTLNDNIRAVVAVAYSAQSNGTGSFRKYRVGMEVQAADQVVRIDASHADKDNTRYTCVPGWVENTPDGVLVHAFEEYSRPGSENRPEVVLNEAGQVQITMDNGPRNDYK